MAILERHNAQFWKERSSLKRRHSKLQGRRSNKNFKFFAIRKKPNITIASPEFVRGSGKQTRHGMGISGIQNKESPTNTYLVSSDALNRNHETNAAGISFKFRVVQRGLPYFLKLFLRENHHHEAEEQEQLQKKLLNQNRSKEHEHEPFLSISPSH